MRLSAVLACCGLGAVLLLQAEPHKVKLGDREIAAESMVHSLLSGEQNVHVRDYLVIEVSFTSARGETLRLAHEQFRLRIDGKKALLFPQAPQMVAASLKYDDWEQRPTVVASGGAGNAGVILGRPRRTERFPGDQRPRMERIPGPVPRAPEQADRSGIERAEEQKPWDLAVSAALPEGEVRTAVKGVIYFPFKGKAHKLKKLELYYNGPAGEASIPLLQ